MLRTISDLLKILVLVALIAAIASTFLLNYYKDLIMEEARFYLSVKISKMTGKLVSVGAVSFIPFQYFSFRNIDILEPMTGERIARIEAISAMPDILSVVVNKQLVVTTEIENLKCGELAANASLLIKFDRNRTPKKTLRPEAIESLSLLDGSVSLGNLLITKARGTFDTKRFDIIRGKIGFMAGETDYFFSFIKKAENEPRYHVSLRSRSLNSKGILLLKDGNASLSDCDGAFGKARFSLNANVLDYVSPKRTFLVEGALAGSLKTENFSAGAAKITTRLSKPASDEEQIAGETVISAGDLLIRGIKLDSLDGAILFDGRTVRVPDLAAKLYGGSLTASISAEPAAKKIPYELSLHASSINFANLSKDAEKLFPIKKDKKNNGGANEISGILDAALSVKGTLKDRSDINGSGKFLIQKGNLGPMPIIMPVLGDMYARLQSTLSPETIMNIESASADFTIENEKISTENLVFWGRDVCVTASGKMDFDGNLDFYFQNRYRGRETSGRKWQDMLRNSLINLGQSLGKAKLKGTFDDQKWSFECGSST